MNLQDGEKLKDVTGRIMNVETAHKFMLTPVQAGLVQFSLENSCFGLENAVFTGEIPTQLPGTTTKS